MLISVLSWLVGGLLVAAIVAVLGFMLATWRIAARAERLVPACGKFIEIDGNRIHYVEEGEGRPIVFLHGLG
ncbi:MAG: alpha/beta hydrolase, partial [Mesorhizobium sp.]